MAKRTKLVFRLLVVVWGMVVIWQTLEHRRVVELRRQEVLRRARDITSTLGLVIRSQRPWWANVVIKQRLEPALKEIVENYRVRSIVLLNRDGEDIVSAGEPVDFGPTGPQGGVYWAAQTVTVINPMDLGTNLDTIVLPDGGPGRGGREGRRGPPPPPPPGEGESAEAHRPGGPPGDPPGTHVSPANAETSLVVAPTNSSRLRTNVASTAPPNRRRERRPFGRPPWLSDEDYQALLKTKGLHGLAIVLPIDSFRAACTDDLWLRMAMGSFAAIAVVGFGLAWRNLLKTSEVQMRLVRASEMNTHLLEMNVAAAGLAHETRNPLNIIRGQAQMISRTPEAPEALREKAVEITEEVDRVTVQLNEFINYSKPREVRRSPVVVNTVVSDVVRALKSDLEDKGVRLDQVEENLTISADQQLLRQVLFNLLMNAIQAVPEKSGQIRLASRKCNAREASFEISDNGPGVPPEHRKDIFRPYFTTRDKGTGLGLAVVKQIAMVHGWEVECLPNNGQGALFRLSRLELVA